MIFQSNYSSNIFSAFDKSTYNSETLFQYLEVKMCEFNVILNGKVQFKDVIYTKVEGDNVTVKNILGEAKEFKNCKIVEVDVNSTRLVLAALKP
jgi:predicted RNA-binding protein